MRLDLGRFDKRKLARILAVGAVALAAGHLVQTVAARQAETPPKTAAAELSRPVGVTQLAAGGEPAAAPPLARSALPAAAFPPLPPALPAPSAALPAASPAVTPAPAANPAPAATALVAADPCPVTLDLMADPGAMIGLTLLAPCRPGERVVLRHAGLAVTAMTTATGALFVALPALETDAAVEVRFANGDKVAGSLAVPDLATLRRFGVQWQGDDAFQVYGVESDRVLSAREPGLVPAVDAPLKGGFLTRLGDPAASAPLMAEIYTYPASAPAQAVVEAAITPATCGREILGETLASFGGVVTVTDLTLAMPECDAVGDFLVLNNLASDLTLAAAN